MTTEVKEKRKRKIKRNKNDDNEASWTKAMELIAILWFLDHAVFYVMLLLLLLLCLYVLID